MGEKKRMPTWLIALVAVVALCIIVIVGVVIGVAASHHNQTTVTVPETSTAPQAIPLTPVQPAKPANLGSAWPTFVTWITSMRNGDWNAAYSTLTESDRNGYSAAQMQADLGGNTWDPSNNTLVSETNDGQKAVLTIHNNYKGTTMIQPFYNEGGAWHIALTEQTAAP